MYQAIARRYRPQTFQDVLGQDPIVQTLKNGIKYDKLPHAFLFSGGRGTGKTTLARLLAKTINCEKRSSTCEPCNTCSSCLEIQSGASLDVLEIDGASHRGIDEIRKICEGVGYATSSLRYKVYIIDEVHMLTKEAFNALLKTLEEPPASAKFIFATTELHKVLPTILSRCQRFHLKNIPESFIVDKLTSIVKDVEREVSPEALKKLASMAQGGLRDAESLLEQLLAFESGSIEETTVNQAFGWMEQDLLFALDLAGKEANFLKAFELAEKLFDQGKHLLHFLEQLTDHFRTIVKVHLGILPKEFVAEYKQAATLYRKEQALSLFKQLVTQQDKMRYHPNPRLALETLLLDILRSHSQIPIEMVLEKLETLETTEKPTTVTTNTPPTPPKKEEPIPPKTPTLSLKATLPPKEEPLVKKEASLPKKNTTPTQPVDKDTLIQFAAVELEGTLQRPS